MNNKYQFILGLIVFILCFNGLHAQEEEKEHLHKHGIGFLISHTYISQGKIDGKREYLAAPSFGINYNYYINEKWAIGLHNDIIIESFLIENSSENSEVLERELPFSNSIMATYKMTKSLGLTFGSGIEWEKNENFLLFRAGVDYAVELNEKGLEMIFVFNYDNLIDGYDSINFGLGLNKLF